MRISRKFLGLVVSGGGGVDPDANLIARCAEDFYGMQLWQNIGNDPPATENSGRGMFTTGGNNGTIQMMTAGSGTATAVVEGRRIRRLNSNGGAISFRRGGNACMPLGARFQVADSLGGALSNRGRWQYLWSMAHRLTVQAAGCQYEHNLSDADPGIAGGGAANRAGAAWVSDLALNGGRWTPRIRLTNGGVLVTGPDTGVLPVNFQLLGIRYTEGPPQPMIEFLLNNSVIWSQAGDVNMPTLGGGGAPEPGFMPGCSFSQHAGSVAQQAQGLFEVRNLG